MGSKGRGQFWIQSSYWSVWLEIALNKKWVLKVDDIFLEKSLLVVRNPRVSQYEGFEVLYVGHPNHYWFTLHVINKTWCITFFTENACEIVTAAPISQTDTLNCTFHHGIEIQLFCCIINSKIMENKNWLLAWSILIISPYDVIFSKNWWSVTFCFVFSTG